MELRVESVQVGKAEPAGDERLGDTGINKCPVESARITDAGLVGDTIVDLDNHGGPDQAVYVYMRDDYRFWEAELGRTLDGGMFGENLTIAGASCQELNVGDRFEVGDSLVLEATCARIPCAKFALKVGEPDWVNRFRDGRRPGLYCRVIAPGSVVPGDRVNLVPGQWSVSVVETQELYYDRTAARERLQAALEAPVCRRMAESLASRLDRIE